MVQTGDNSDLHPRSKSLVKSQAKNPHKSKSNSDYKGPVGQEPTSYKGITINIYTVDGILRYSLRESDHIETFTHRNSITVKD